MKKFFPLFVDIRNKKVLIIGYGNVAKRREEILTGFGADVVIISPEINRKYRCGDIADTKPWFVIAATDDRKVNQAVAEEAADLNIPVSVADCSEECTCYFPAIAESDDYIAGIVSKNGDHKGVKHIAEKFCTIFS